MYRASLYTRQFLLLMAATFAFFASMYLLLASLPLYVVDVLGGDDLAVGLVTGAFAITAVLVRPVVGRLVDTWGRRPVLLLGGVVFGLLPLGYILARSIPALLALRLVHGLGIAAFTTAATTLVADLAAPEQRGQAMSVFGVASLTAMALGPSVGAEVMKAWGFEALFLTAAGLGLASVALGVGVREPTLPPPMGEVSDREPAGQPGFRDTFRLRGVGVPSLALAAAATTYGGIITFLPLLLQDRGLADVALPGGLEMSAVGLFFLVYAGATIVVRFGGGSASDRWGRVPVIAPALVLVSAGLVLLAWWPSLTGLLVAAVVYGLGLGLAWPTLNALVVDRAPVRVRGLAVSIVSASFDLGVALGASVLGVVAGAWGHVAMYTVAASICLLTTAAFVVLIRPQRHVSH